MHQPFELLISLLGKDYHHIFLGKTFSVIFLPKIFMYLFGGLKFAFSFFQETVKSYVKYQHRVTNVASSITPFTCPTNLNISRLKQDIKRL